MSDAEFELDAESFKAALQNAYERGADIGGYSMLVGMRRLIDMGEPVKQIRVYIQETLDSEYQEMPDNIKADIDRLAEEEL